MARIMPSRLSEAGRKVRKQQRRAHEQSLPKCASPGCLNTSRLDEEFCGVHMPDPEDDEPPLRLRDVIFKLLTDKYVQSADARQRAMGLQYMEVETHDLAEQIERWFLTLDRIKEEL